MSSDPTIRLRVFQGQCYVLFLCLIHSVAFQPTINSNGLSSELLRSREPLAVLGSDQQSTNIRRLSERRTTMGTTTALSAKLWDRLQIEEDPEPFWYLLNCVAGLELDLLKQCRDACDDLPDCIKFVVPTEKKTRSHGANRMVTETKVKYQGYVFAKLRLCPEVYETIQQLDLCRSWMGTVNHKGYNKLPPAPVALNEMEVENFGLEEYEEDEEEESIYENAQDEANGVILDSAENEEKGEPKIDQEAIKAYLGLKVEDMIKVTARGKFFNEDGIVRRLKDGKIFVRFYTYGTMFEEWLDPSDVRKLSNTEILKGLSGPSEPVTQREFDHRQQGGGRSYSGNRPFDRPQSDGDLRRSLMGNAGGGPRNRRQDRNERNFQQRRDHFGRSDEEQRNERNWNWYQDQQRSQRADDARDGDTGMISGSERQRRQNDWAIGNVDSQWGRGGRNDNNYNRGRQNDRYNRGNQNDRYQRRDRRDRPDRFGNDNRRNNNNRQANRQANAAIDGDGDWSAFVSSSPGRDEGKDNTSGEEDDFFSSLMNDLSQDRKNTRGGNRDNDPISSASDDDFFDSLLEDLKEDSGPKQTERKQPTRRQKTEKKAPAAADTMDDDFFSSLEAELGSALESKQETKSSSDDLAVSDDFFAQLEAELSVEPSKPKKSNTGSSSDDLFAALEMEMDSTQERQKTQQSKQRNPNNLAPTAADDDFFASLESELDSSIASSDATEKQSSPEKNFDDEDFFASLEKEMGTSDTDSVSSGASDGDLFDGLFDEPPSPPKSKKKQSAKKADTTVDKASAVAASSSSGSSLSNLQKQTVPVLKDMLRERGLKVSGKKAELIERLMQSS